MCKYNVKTHMMIIIVEDYYLKKYQLSADDNAHPCLLVSAEMNQRRVGSVLTHGSSYFHQLS